MEDAPSLQEQRKRGWKRQVTSLPENLYVLIVDTQILDLLTENKDLTNQED